MTTPRKLPLGPFDSLAVSEADRARARQLLAAQFAAGYACGRAPVVPAAPVPPPDESVPRADAPPADPGPAVRIDDVVELNTVDAKDVTWLWKPWLPGGKLAMLDGDPGQGKSYVTLDLVTRLSRGDALPDGQPNPFGGKPVPSLLISCEDGLADTVVPRLRAMGADLRRVASLQGAMKNGTVVRPLQLPRDTPALLDIITQVDIKYVVIDPVMAFLAACVNTVSDQAVRIVLGQLALVAEQTGCTIQFVRHLNKTGGRPAIYRGGGSIGLIAAMRAGWLIGRDPNDRDRRVLTMVKCNLGPEPKSLAFRLTPARGDPNRTVVTWEGEIELTANDLVNDVRQGVKADEWLKRALAGGPRKFTELEAEAVALGIGERALMAAKRQLAVRSMKRGGRHDSAWYWALPTATHEPGGGLPPLPGQLVPEDD
jgi:hypothetical protein